MNNIKQGLLKALCLLTIVLLGGKAADAANRIYVENFTIGSYDVTPVKVMFEFDEDDIAAFNLDIVLPEGLTLVGQPEANSAVVPATSTLMYNGQNGRLMLVPMPVKPLKAQSGHLCTLNLMAEPGMLDAKHTATMELNRISLSDTKGTEIKLDNETTEVTFEASTAATTFSETSFVINPGGSHIVNVGVDNSMSIKGATVEIVLPEGFTVKNEEFNLTSRCSASAMASPYSLKDANGYRIVIVDMTGAMAINGNSGDFLTFEVEAPEGFTASEAIIEVRKMQISDAINKRVDALPSSVKVINGRDAYVKAMDEVGRLEQLLSDALAEIAEAAKDVKDQFTGEEVSAQIQALKDAIDAAYDDTTLTSDYDKVMAGVPAIEASIVKLIEDAKSAQKAYEELAAEAARQEAYKNANAQIDALRQSLSDALATIAEEAADVKDDFTGTEITAAIDALKASVDKAFEDKTIVADYDNLMAGVPAIKDSIAKLIVDAKSAQKAYEDELARQAANLAAYEADLAAIEALQEKLDKTVDEIRLRYPAFEVDSEKESAQAAIDSEKEKAENAYADVEEEGEYANTVDTAAVEALIADLLTKAEESVKVGIYEIIGEDIDNISAIYTRNGVRVSVPQHGEINVVVFKNGTSRKVYVR